VEFKRVKEKFEKSATCPEDFEVGDCVKVEGSRGQNIGVICNIDVQSSDDVPFFGPDGQESFKKIVSRASEHERKNLMTKLRDEDRALHICNELAARRGLPILIVDAEFQFDRNKLTFSYISDRSVQSTMFSYDITILQTCRLSRACQRFV
jgi:cell fate regulator YaaT (PSP1 superfamily)